MAQPGDHALGWIIGRGQLLVALVGAAVLLVENEVGERATDVDAESEVRRIGGHDDQTLEP